MTESLFQDAVAIDTNVFEHLLNQQNNVGRHIDALLAHLQELGVSLLMDDKNRIGGEYDHHIRPMFQKADDERTELLVLRYWILFAPRIPVAVNGTDNLMNIIKGVIVEPQEAVDRIFTYVALTKGKLLVSNDKEHIVFGPSHESRLQPRRHRMLRDSRRFRPRGAEIRTSLETHSAI